MPLRRFRVQGLGFGVRVLGFRVLGFRVQGLGLGFRVLGFRVQGLGSGFGFWVWCLRLALQVR